MLKMKFFKQVLVTCLLFFFFTVFTHAQTNDFSIKWTSNVGCVNFLNPEERERESKDGNEEIEDSNCHQICEYSTAVEYYVDSSNFQSIQWSVVGGTIVGSSTNQSVYVDWGVRGDGQISVQVINALGNLESFIKCVKIIASPEAKFTINNDQSEFCLESTLYFNNLSHFNGGSQLYSYYWDFGDNTFSSEFEPTKTYSEQGVYPVTLTVTNECHCISVYKLEVYIKDEKADPIKCPSVVCDNEVVRYSTDGCPDWEVIGGTIVSNSGNEIEVVWDQVDNSGFGYVIVNSSCGCVAPVVEKIPVVKSSITLAGPDVICKGERFTFSIPQWPTTEIVWTLSTPSAGDLQITDQRNEISVRMNEVGTYTLTANYRNTLLGCEGIGKKVFHVREKAIVSGPKKICQNTSASFTTNATNGLIWKLYKGSVLVEQSTNAVFTKVFDQAGIYKLTSSAFDFCESEGYIIEVIAKPNTPIGTINGENRICPNRVYEYSFTNTDPNVDLEWYVVNGTITGSNMGSYIAVNFDNNANTFEVWVRALSKDPLKCPSDYLKLQISKDTVNPVINNIDNVSLFCPSTFTSYSTNLQVGVDVDEIRWEIVNPSLGNITSGSINTSTINVLFNEAVAGSANGFIRLRYKKCEEWLTVDKPFTIKTVPTITLDSVPNVCSNENIIPVISITNGTLSNANVEWFINSVPVATSVASGNVITPPSNLMVNNTSGISQNYTLKIVITNINGCNKSLTLTKDFTVFPNANIRVSPSESVLFCSGTTGWSHTFTINYVGNGTLKFYELVTGNELTTGPNFVISNNSITVTDTTQYYAEVTFNGCVYRSNNFGAVYHPCIPACIATDPYITSTITSSCNTFNLTSSFTTPPTSFNILYSSGGISMTLNPPFGATFTIDEPGEYPIFIEYTSGGCSFRKQVFIVKDFKPDFFYNYTCPNASNISTVTIDDSTIYYNQPAVKRIKINSGSFVPLTYPYNVNLAPGTYEVTIEYTLGSVVCTKTKNIEILANPISTFSSPSMQACFSDGIHFIPTVQDPNNSYTWSFNGVTNTQMFPTLQLQPGSGLTVSLTVTNSNGCSTTSTVSGYVIFDPNFVGDIVGAGTFCEGSSPQLTFVPNASSTPAASYQWYLNGNAIAGAINNTYTPTVTGSYSVGGFDSNGCFKSVDNFVNVAFKPKPFLSVSGAETVCMGKEFTMYVNTIAGAEVQVSLNGSLWHPWSTQLEFAHTQSYSGLYEYYFEVRDPSDPSCVNSFRKIIEVVAPPTFNFINYTVVTCSPYLVKLNVDGDNYTEVLWSNGDRGEHIETHEGGVYQVTLINAEGCAVTGSVYVPKDPNVYSWVFPTGCITVCPKEDPYIIGPSPTVNFFPSTWQNYTVGSNVSQVGATPNYTNLNSGVHDLTLSSAYCEVSTDYLHLVLKCPEGNCDFEFKLDYRNCNIDENGQVYYIFDLTAYNPHSYVLTGTLQSPQGVFVSNSFNVLSNASTTAQVLFYPNTSFTGILNYYVTFENAVYQVKCEGKGRIELPTDCEFEGCDVKFDFKYISCAYDRNGELYYVLDFNVYNPQGFDLNAFLQTNQGVFVPNTALISANSNTTTQIVFYPNGAFSGVLQYSVTFENLDYRVRCEYDHRTKLPLDCKTEECKVDFDLKFIDCKRDKKGIYFIFDLNVNNTYGFDLSAFLQSNQGIFTPNPVNILANTSSTNQVIFYPNASFAGVVYYSVIFENLVNFVRCEYNSKTEIPDSCRFRECFVEYDLRFIKCEKPRNQAMYYLFDLGIQNQYNYNLTVNLQSPYGVFVPNTITLTPNSANIIPIMYYPNTFVTNLTYTLSASNITYGVSCTYDRAVTIPRGCAETLIIDVPIITLYPNPTTNATTAKIEELDITEPTFLEVYNMIGIKVHQAKVTSLTNNVIPTYNWPAGSYIVVIKQNNEIKLQTHLIKK